MACEPCGYNSVQLCKAKITEFVIMYVRPGLLVFNIQCKSRGSGRRDGQSSVGHL